MKEKRFLRKEKAARSIDMTMEQCTRREALGLAWALSCSLPEAQAKPSLRLPGMVWQPSADTLRPHGSWQRLGIRRLLVQWTAVDNLSLVPGTYLPSMSRNLPDWERIAAEPWAQELILGLAGMHDEAKARAGLADLAMQSYALKAAITALPLRVAGWYFPVEVDPTWAAPSLLTEVLNKLPRPLWISAYDNANMGPQALVDWIMRWIPEDVGVFFQDGVGVHARTPSVAREYLQMLTAHLGQARVRVIAEAFRPAQGGGFRSAMAEEFLPQLAAYQGWTVFAFDGPHYLNPPLVDALADALGSKSR
ncbi:hypothetical protein HNB49_06170 [Comamonas thiooxydans]|nr:conserved hypothetical protein [Comamonas thiooxydans]MDO1473307.1 hypothetical protein [Comamonas thiooxydans]